MTLRQFTQELSQTFRSLNFEQPLSEAQFLISGVLGQTRTQIISNDQQELSIYQLALLQAAVHRRSQGEPLAYILGTKDFYKAQFAVGPQVLIPRPETELMVETALEKFSVVNQPLQMADFGAGTGCIGISILLERPMAKLVAIENSVEAQSFLKKNITTYLLDTRVTIYAGTVESFHRAQRFDLIVANPPYIAWGDPNVMGAVYQFEPHEALYADEDGLGAIRRWAKKSVELLKPEGVLLIEIGAGQDEQWRREPWSTYGLRLIEIRNDLAGLPRLLVMMLDSK